MTRPGFRGCSRNGCPASAVATLTYSYADQTAVLGALAVQPDPHTYDLCAQHTERLTVPRGWDVVRLPLDPADLRRQDDLLDLADALHRPNDAPRRTRGSAVVSSAPVANPNGPRHRLRVLPDAE